TPGFALPGVIGLLSLGLFFWGHWIVQLAGWEELLLVAIGLALLAIEIFILPGVTVAGLAGVVALVAGRVRAVDGAGAMVATFVRCGGRVAMAILVALAAGFLLLRLLPRLPCGRELVLTTEVPADQVYVSPPRGDQSWLGRSGIASSPLRPAGIAHIDGVRVDVVSDGAFIEAGAAIDVIRVDGNRIVVRRSRTEDSDHD